MKKTQGRYSTIKRIAAFLLAFVMVAGYFPTTNVWTASAAEITTDLIATAGVDTVADPETLTRPSTIYGDNTLNAGKVTVGKSVSNSSVTVNGQSVELSDPDNFLVTITQTAQVMGLSSESSVPVDVVFVLDTSGSMDDNDRAETLVTAANSAIATLMETNEQNRVAVVAFSSEGEYGGGTSNGAAANVLSSLAHYTGDAATAHLQWVNNQGGTTGNNRSYIAGRDTATIRVNNQPRTVNAFRHGKNGGTNIQAGIVAGAKLLTSVTDTTWTNPETNETVTRIPFLIVISDGQPTFSYDDSTWYNPTTTGDNAADEQGPGSGAYEGNGFIAALTAAYYKGAITQHYYGDKANNENHCFVYTMGVEIEALDDYENRGQTVSYVDDNQSLAEITLDPAANAVDGEAYYTYGNAWNNDQNKTTTHGWKTYWANYLAGNNFTVRVDRYDGRDETYTFTAASIAASKPYVNGVGYTGGLGYNDEYFAADNVADMEAIFEALLRTIQEKAISVPTKVTTGDHDFDGYVTFTDPIGEYMEVKDMKGIIANGNFYKGATAAQYLQSGANAEFNALIKKVLETRMSMTASSGITADEILAAARASANQAYYNSATDYDNSIVWWGKTYSTGEEDTGMQVLGAADNDSIDYITASTTAIPAGADHVCRSYFFYGTAGSTVDNPNHEYLYFVVRIQRSLTAPYQQTVVISAPASLLSMEKVLVTESTDDNGNTVYTASVEEADPARVVYEVGLRSDITAENVATIVSEEYKNETVNGSGSVNYDAATDSYSFFTNDWDRTQSTDSHHRAQAKATFDAAADNAFYTYQEDTLIVDASGNAVTSDPKGTTAYYVREYYDWTGASADADGNYTAIKKTELIKIDIPSDATLVNKDGKWYLPKGAYTGATLIVNGDDTTKTSNNTGTATAVAHPHRTGDQTNSHYTVLLGNNGKLTLKANTPEPKKSVQVNNTVVDGNGVAVQVGDNLTYSITVENALDKEATYTITDQVPAGTAFVSADNGGTESNGVVTWSVKIPAGGSVTVKMTVQVTKDALNTAVVPGTIQNTAVVTFPNGAKYETNPVENPPYGKTASDASGNDTATQSGYNVGDVITFSIRYHNNETNDNGEYVAADITITDKLPAGTELVEGSISHGGTMADDGTITWKLEGVQPNMAGVVTFRVKITADAVSPVTNSADITVGNNPTITTNSTETKVNKGDLVLTKTVADGDDTSKEFTLTLTESTGKLSGTFEMTVGTSAGTVTFNDQGYASITIKHGQTVTIKGLPAGVKITVAELAPDGWTATYNDAATAQQVTIVAGDTNKATVNVNNDYHAKPVIFQLKGTKTFVGSNFPAGVTFSFQAVQCNADGSALEGATPITVYAEVTSPNGEIVFSPREFTAEMDRYYKITEAPSTVPGLITDGSAYLLHLKVEDNQSGDLELTYTLTKDGAVISTNDTTDGVKTGTVTVEGANFTNTYPDSTSITLGGDKTLTGRYQEAGEFDFQLLVPANNTIGSGDATVIDTATNVVDGDNAHNGSFTFQPITYTAADMVNADGSIATEKTFIYYIREVPGQASYITYDPAYYVVTVTVKNVNGKLEATKSIVKYENADDTDSTSVDAISFSNVFQVQDTRVTLTGSKTLTGRTMTAGEFSFSVYKADEQGNYTEAQENLVSSGVNTAGGEISFSPIGITIADMDGVASKNFYFVVKEDRPAEDGATFDPNMYYDPAEYLVKVTVTYKAEDGSLTAGAPVVVKTKTGDTWTDAAAGVSIAFNNIQNPDSVSVTPEGNKKTTGTALPDGLRFSFRVTSDYDGNMLAGTGTSQGTVNNNGESVNAIEFTALVITDKMFAEAEKNADGSATFTYYIRESNTASNNGVDYDESVYKYEVSVKRDQYNKLVKVEGSEKYYKQTGDTWTEAAVLFENVYAAQGHINLTAEKNTEGTFSLAGNDFDFRLQRLDQDGKLVEGSAINGSNDANGTVTFGTVNFHSSMLTDDYKHTAEDGTNYWLFNYLMSEIKPDTGAIPGVKYDESQYIVTVKLTVSGEVITATLDSIKEAQKKDDGSYTAAANAEDKTVNATDANNTGVTFTNTYSVQEGTEVTIEATKTLTGRDFIIDGNGNGEFGFALYRYGGKDDQGNEIWHNIGTAFNDANGNISFTRHYNATTLSHLADAFQDIDEDGKDEYVVIYRINEINGGLGGITYSGASYYAKVIIEHDEDASKYVCESVTYYTDAACTQPAETVAFSNTYTTNDVDFTPVASKELVGAELAGYNFSFEIVETDATGEIKTNDVGASVVAATGHSDETGKVNFNKVIFNGQTEVKCEGKVDCDEHEDNNTDVCTIHNHYYMIRENHGTADGITYSTQNYYIKVEIHDDGMGGLTVQKVTYYTDRFQTETAEENVVFTNHYGPGSVNLDLQVNKEVLVRYPAAQTFALRATPVIDPEDKYELTGSEFDFEVYEANDKFEITNNTAVASGTNGAGSGSAVVSFSTITYTREDAYANGVVVSGQESSQTYYYVIRELAPSEGSVPGVTIDSKQINVTVTVTDDGYGNMTATAVYSDGDEDETNNTTFTNIYEVKDPVSVTLTAVKELTGKDMETFRFQLKKGDEVLQTKENDGTTVTFDPLTFYLPGTYTYTVSEVNEGKANMTYDGTVYNVTIEVWDDREGQLYTVVTVTDGTNTVDLMQFNNSYDHPDLVIGLSDQINADKTVVGPNGESLDYMLGSYTFQFEVIDILGNPVLDASGNKMIGKTDANGNINFPNFKFEVAGEYHYLIREIVDESYGDKKITADGQVWCAHIQVIYDRTAGLLKLADNGVITHLYSADAHSADGIAAQASETPVFVNKYDPENVSVTVMADKELVGRELKDNEFTFQLLDENGLIAAEAKNHADGSITFYLNYELADLEGEASKTFTYKMVEVIPDTKLGGVKYTDKTATVTVKVTDNQEGKLKASVSGDGATFTNKYDAADGTAVIEAVKVLEGIGLNGRVFQFELLDENNQPIKDADGNPITATNDADGKVRFQLTMTEAGTFTYIIREVKGNVPGVTYDEHTYKATVTVTDNLLGQLTCVTTYEDGVVPTFVNVYETDGATVTFEATKNLIGNTLVGDDFEFLLLDEVGNEIATAKNAADGKVYLYYTFEEAGDYTFTLVEKAGSDDHIDYDDQKVTVTVKVADNGEGKLVAEAPVYQTADGKAPVFENTYTPDPIDVTVEASKTLNGGQTLKVDAFEFQLLDGEGKVVASTKNDADGKIHFQLGITAAGTYTYTMVEKAGTDSHITYDGTKYTVTVKVTSDAEGVLSATVIYGTKSGKAPVFENTYTPDAIKVSVEASKTLTGGKTLKADAFEFQLLDGEGKVVATAKNAADGKISFQLDITAAGTYTYTMVEKAGTDSHITYDAHKYTVTVKVENDGEGILAATVTYGTTDGKAPVFQNTWKPEKISILLTGTKTLTGRDMKAGEFKFEVRDTTGTLVATGTNDAEGKITFTPVGIVTKGTYLLTVSEVQGSAEYVTYDKTTFQVKVVVENVDGALVPTVTGPEDGITFTNSYDEPANPETGDDTPIFWMVGLLVISGLAIVLLVAMRPKRGGKYAR